ncbi:MCM DNA helicase complex subunit [Irineochytrium annulatum]|nr:MCM DNA helicase complex subunit [Irineochytrium annulatum]
MSLLNEELGQGGRLGAREPTARPRLPGDFAPAPGADGLRNISSDDEFQERVRFYVDFLDRDFGDNEYKTRIAKMLASGKRRLLVNINDLRAYNMEYANGLLQRPVDFIPPFDKALKDVCLASETYAAHAADFTNDGQLDIENVPFSVGFEGSFGSLVRPKVVKSVHYCEKTETFHARDYRDGSSLSNNMPTSYSYPKEVITLQEMPERSPAGQMPRPVDVLLDDDLVDCAKPGDRVQVVGVYRAVGNSGNTASASFRTMILANNVRQLGHEAQRIDLTDKDIVSIKKIAKRRDAFELLSFSLASSIYGHEMIKKAILLMLLGGMEKNLANGTHIRGDINMLMIGDPSTAKSQLLRFVLNIAPLAIATTGRGSSGVGLTAAVTHDKETGERTLEAGAMVLGDRGVVCIDEFDKMSDIDRVAIHEVMEQQTVTIAKAGIHTSLNARCSVIAAANPAFGQYDDTKSPSQNIPLPDSLLSRFDLLFVVLDNMTDAHNRKVADHIVRLHRFIPQGLEEGAPITDNTIAGLYSTFTDETAARSGTEVFTKYNKLLHLGIEPASTPNGRTKKKVEILSIPFMKKFIHYAKTRCRPILTQEASKLIGETYGELRIKRDGENKKYRTMPITARTLETLIRLSSAHAKSRLSSRVEEDDVEVAAEILGFALYQEKKAKKKKRVVKRAKVGSDEEEEEEEEDDDDDDDESGGDGQGGPGGMRKSQRKPRTGEDQALEQAVGNMNLSKEDPNAPIEGSLTLAFVVVNTSVEEFNSENAPTVLVAETEEGSQRTSVAHYTVTGSSLSGPSTTQLATSHHQSLDRMDEDVEMGNTVSNKSIQFQLEDERYRAFKDVWLPPINARMREMTRDQISIIDLTEEVNKMLPMSQHMSGLEAREAIIRLASEETAFMYEEETESLILV